MNGFYYILTTPVHILELKLVQNLKWRLLRKTSLNFHLWSEFLFITMDDYVVFHYWGLECFLSLVNEKSFVHIMLEGFLNSQF